MIKTIYQFGQQLQKMENMKRYFEIFGSPYSERAENEKVIVVEIVAKQFSKLWLDDYRKVWNDKYLFRELASARSTSIVPTLHFYNLPVGEKPETRAKNEKELEVSIEKFLDKLKRCFDTNSTIYENLFDAKNILESLKTNLKHFVISNCADKKNYLLTLKIDGQWIGDIPEIKEVLEDEAYNKYFSSKGEDFKSKDKICAVTYQKANEVWGRVDTLGFTVNDITFSRNGFDAKDSYKMFPVSVEAVKVLEGTRRALEDGLSFGFSNLKFFVLPHFVALTNDILRGEVVEVFVQQNVKSKSTATETQSKSIISSEKIFDEIINDEKLSRNSLYYDIFFYEQKQAQFSIKLHVSDVLPSRFKTIIEAKEAIENQYDTLTRVVSKKQEVYHFYLTFRSIKDYFPEPFFFQIMEAIFYKNPVSERQVLEAFMKIIVAAFKNPSDDPFKLDNFPQSVKKTFVIHQYFQTLKLFGNMENQEKTPISVVAENFVEQHPNFFQHEPLKIAAFYLGCATEVLLNAQESHLGSRPFKHKLNNLNIGYREMMSIKPKLLDKTEEYQKADKLYGDYPDFLKLINAFDMAFAEGEEKDQDKIVLSYSFSLGLTTQREFFNNRIHERSVAKKQRQLAEKQKAETQQ